MCYEDRYYRYIMLYGVIFWGDSADRRKLCNTQKKIVRLMPGIKN
jgi:hypothetical protein